MYIYMMVSQLTFGIREGNSSNGESSIDDTEFFEEVTWKIILSYQIKSKSAKSGLPNLC